MDAFVVGYWSGVTASVGGRKVGMFFNALAYDCIMFLFYLSNFLECIKDIKAHHCIAEPHSASS